jgi:uncharacterized repeat protein (TIGR03803 family)
MKVFLKLSLLFSLIFGAKLASAQSIAFTNLYFFSATDFSTGSNIDGAIPYSGVILVSNALYGTTYLGGQYGDGVLYKLVGTNLTVLHNFNGAIDGSEPQSDLLLISNSLYGTASLAGPERGGTIFRYDLNSSNFTVIDDFGNAAFTGPSELFYTNGVFYGTAASGPIYGDGVIFAAPLGGGSVTDLFDFGYTDGTYPAPITPGNGVLKVDDIFYGTTTEGGTGGGGTVYKLSGGNLVVLQAFTNSAYPQYRLVLSGNTLFGMTEQGGDNSSGSIFRVNTDGSAYTNLYSFDYYPQGANPQRSLTMANGVLYGTAAQGGAVSGAGGVVFQINPDGTGYTVLHSFASFGIEGNYPESDIFVSGNNLYGTTSTGGPGKSGGVFMITLSPPAMLDLKKINGSLVLSWANTNYSLQFTTNLNTSFTTIAGATSPYTNQFDGMQKFFRLVGN